MVDKVRRDRLKARLRIDDRWLATLNGRFPIIYAVVLIIFCLVYRVLPAPDFLVLCFLIYAAHLKRAQRFLKDWFPFIALLLAYDSMRGIVSNVAGMVHSSELIGAELYLFGVIPTQVLQQFYRMPVLDWMGAFFYSLHFVVPFLFGFVLWFRSPENYRKYTATLLITSYSALITFLVYPAAPPWFGVGAERILFQIDGALGVPFYATVYALIQPNPFAAIPSLHAAYAWIVALFAVKVKGVRALPVFVFPLGVWFSAVYLGEHYIIDLVAGVAYSTVAYFVAGKLAARFRKAKSEGQKHSVSIGKLKQRLACVFRRGRTEDGDGS